MGIGRLVDSTTSASIPIGLDADLGAVFNVDQHDACEVLLIQILRVLRQIEENTKPRPTA